jgi:hypothetical protein
MIVPEPGPANWPWFQVLYEMPRALDVDQVELIALIRAVPYANGEVVTIAHFNPKEVALALWVRSRTLDEALAAGERTLQAMLPELEWRLVGVLDKRGLAPQTDQ